MGLIALVGLVLCSSPIVQASCGDYVYSRFSRMSHTPEGSSAATQGEFVTRERSEAGDLIAAGRVMKPGQSSLEPASSVLELYRRTACRGPHCQKAPVNAAVPDGPMVMHRVAKDLIDQLNLVTRSGLRGGSLFMARDLARPHRGFPLHPEIPPEVA